ncbi:RhoGAP-domain-containing protein, partial [Microstroma glucosiphilum]
LDSYVQSIVFQSGIDNERRPIVVLSSPALPDPKEVNYDDLLTRIMDQMELFVQNEYTVVFFAGGSSHRPPWAWLWSAYRRLSRPFRKNCRRLFICHPTFFTRSLVRIVSTGSAVLSPKFAKKITQVNSLSELAEKIDLTQIDIPPDVLKWNMHYEKEVKIPATLIEEKTGFLDATGELVSTSSKLFGVPLDALMGEKGEKGGIPRVVKDCVEELQPSPPISNLDTEGLFRKSGSTALLQAAQQAYDRGSPVSLKQYDDAHIPAGLLKLYFRSLPDPIFSLSMYPLIRKCPHVEEGDEDSVRDAIIYLQDVILPAILPQSKLILLSYVLEVLHKVSRRSERNKMDATNLATVWGPNLVRSSDPLKDMAMCAVAGAPKMSTSMPHAGSTGKLAGSDLPPTTLGTLLKLCIDRYYEIFE